MLIKIKRSWELPERAATPENVFLNRRRIIKAAAAGPVLLGTAGLLAACGEDEQTAAQGDGGTGDSAGLVSQAQAAEAEDPSAGLYPFQRNLRYRLDREQTSEEIATTYNNYYEFGSSKNIWRKAQALPIRPWTITLDGLVEKPQEIGFDDLLAKMPLEERLYRHRCVEAWSMAVPWSGFPMRALVELAKPLSSAKFVKIHSFLNPEVASGQSAPWYPWPYVEGVTLAEATNDLAFLVTGMYGKPGPKQNGAPLRIALPWKYGFKSSKGLVRFEFTDQRPVSFWEEIQPSEYGFWANVNPEVPHPRWSQATERQIGTDERVPTLLYNGYGEAVADLYTGLEGEKLFM